MNLTTTVRTCVLATTFAAASLTLVSCGDDVRPPAQDIGFEQPEPPQTKTFEPACNTRASDTPCPDPTYGPNRQKLDHQPAPNRQKLDSEFLPGR